MKRQTIYDICSQKGTFLFEMRNMFNNVPTPELFDFWHGMYFLSSITNRNVAISIDDKLYFPNLYTLFVSDNSALLEDAQRVLEDIENLTTQEDHVFINTYTSPSSFIDMLADRTKTNLLNNVRIGVSSMSVFCKSKDCINMMTDLYSCPTNRSGYNGKFNYIYKNVFVTFAGKCCANEYFNNVDKSLYDDEFLARTFVIPTNKAKTAKERPEDTEHNITKFIKDLQEKTKTPVFITYEPYAARLLKRYARSNGTKRYGARPYESAIKLSGLLALNENKEIISIQHVKNAYKLLEALMRQTNIYITKREFEESNKQYKDAITKILSVIMASGECGIGHNEVYQKVRYYITNDEFVQIMTILFEYNLITKYLHMNGKAIIYAPNENTDKLDCKSTTKLIKTLLSAK